MRAARRYKKDLRIQRFVGSLLKAQQDLVWRATGVASPLAELCRDAVVDARQDAAGCVPVALAVPAVLIAGAVCLDTENLALDARYRNVEVIVAATACAAG